jgi:hypothetical protein
MDNSELCQTLLTSIRKIFKAIDRTFFGEELPSIQLRNGSSDELLLANPDGKVYRIRVDIVDVSYYDKAVTEQHIEEVLI